jgi:hypothetical protein
MKTITLVIALGIAALLFVGSRTNHFRLNAGHLKVAAVPPIIVRPPGPPQTPPTLPTFPKPVDTLPKIDTKPAKTPEKAGGLKFIPAIRVAA